MLNAGGCPCANAKKLAWKVRTHSLNNDVVFEVKIKLLKISNHTRMAKWR